MHAALPLSDTIEPSAAPDGAPRSVSVLGATGSIGASTVDLLRRHPGRYRVEALSANTNAADLARLARELGARFAAVADPSAFAELKAALAGSGIEAAAGESGLVAAASRPADWIMAAISGASGLAPTLAALEHGRTVALANKECLVCAGALFMRRAQACGATVLPVDSEHNAIFQAMGAGRPAHVARIVLTASGGPFRTFSREQLASVTLEQALRHPNWSMGQKITIDSASMMNKGLEVIEAHHLFDLAADRIDVLVHPESVIHGMVEFSDRAVVATLGAPDMRIPIAHCLAWPERIEGPSARLDLAALGKLTFEAPDTVRFPALALARQVLQAGEGAPTVLNAANEIAVAAFIAGRLPFMGIPALVEASLAAASARGLMREPASAEEALTLDRAGRALACELAPQIAVKSF